MTSISLNNFTYIMKKASKPYDIYICSNLLGNMDSNFCFLQSMDNQILSVRSPELKTSQNCKKLNRQIENPNFMSYPFSFFQHHFLKFFFSLAYNLLNSKWLYSCILQELLKTKPPNLPSN